MQGDPNTVSSFEPKPTPAMNWLFVFGSFAMASLSLWLAFSNGVGALVRLFLGVGAAFFFYTAFIQARRANTRRAAGFDASGLWIDGPRERKVIPWNNIEAVQILSISSQEMNIVALKQPDHLVAQYDVDEAKIALRQDNLMGGFAAVTGLQAGRAAADLAEMFAKRRKQWGGEVWLSVHDRDRNAREFSQLIEAWRQKYEGETP